LSDRRSGSAPDGADGNFEGRWNPWRGRGLAHGPWVRYQLRELAPLFVIVAVVVYLFVLMW
jgi:hypothetical protein